MIRCELVQLAQDKYGKEKRNAKAKRYIRKCAIKRNAMLIGIISLAIIPFFVFSESEYTYAAMKPNGMGYEYHTDAKAKIASVDLDNSIVNIIYKGNEYAYKANGIVPTTETIVVTFNEAMEIIGVKQTKLTERETYGLY